MASRLFKAKKYVASRMSESASGRAVITQFIGSAGDAVFQSLRSATEHFAGAARAKQMKVDIFKLVTKAALLSKNKTLTDASTEPARAPVALLASLSIEVLERGPGGAPTGEAELAAALLGARDALHRLLQPHIREHNLARLGRVFGFFADGAFLSAFLRAPEYAGERETLLLNLHALAAPYESELAAGRAFRADMGRRRASALSRLLITCFFFS